MVGLHEDGNGVDNGRLVEIVVMLMMIRDVGGVMTMMMVLTRDNKE